MNDPDESLSRHRLAEVAGGATAECAAVVCCFPCTVVHFIVLAVYKLPAGLYRKAVKRKRRRRLLKKGLLIQRPNGEINAAGHRVAVVDGERFVTKSVESDEDFIEFENEMWEKFYGTGFFRSLSQRVN
ncbi:hypothetical protein Hdeb2414_s0023g00634361 [Helianthus debilis subsp. tardiflorus]|nr:hypothetical protein HanLR1_Chr14g0546121 [Helianthus annuus]